MAGIGRLIGRWRTRTRSSSWPTTWCGTPSGKPLGPRLEKVWVKLRRLGDLMGTGARARPLSDRDCRAGIVATPFDRQGVVEGLEPVPECCQVGHGVGDGADGAGRTCPRSDAATVRSPAMCSSATSSTEMSSIRKARRRFLEMCPGIDRRGLQRCTHPISAPALSTSRPIVAGESRSSAVGRSRQALVRSSSAIVDGPRPVRTQCPTGAGGRPPYLEHDGSRQGDGPVRRQPTNWRRSASGENVDLLANSSVGSRESPTARNALFRGLFSDCLRMST